MPKPVENDGTWNMYKDIVEQSKELEEDIRRLHGLLLAASDYYEEMFERYCELPGWYFLRAQMSMTLPRQHEILLAVIPEEEQEPSKTTLNINQKWREILCQKNRQQQN